MPPKKPELSTKTLPKVIFFDAMGTLFELKTSVGEIYQQHAFKYGVEADDQALQKAFIQSFKSAPPLAFSTTELSLIKQQEFDWWKTLVKSTFLQLDLFNKFSDFSEFFTEIYDYFATKEPWQVFPDTVDSLQKWQNLGIQLGIISNFDSRLVQVLRELNLTQFFSSVTISSLAGFAKPEPNIFKIALKKHKVDANQAWHVGDNLVEDYQGASNVGINSFWLNGDANSLNIENQLPNLSSLG
ncbi:MAG: HAD-IA family hydrolase [Cyanobacteria bacterium P01_A01_bin.83]